MLFKLRIIDSKYFLPILMGIFSIILFIQSDHYFKWSRYPDLPEKNPKTIHTDGAGYYAYLPEWFLYEDEKPFEFTGKITQKYGHASFENGLILDTNRWLRSNKCFPGVAISTIPSFLATSGAHKILGKEVDGYSWGFELMIAINSILFWLIGCIAIIKLLKFWEIPNWWIAVLITTITFGTGINFYTVYFPSFSHICSFLWISWFVYFAARWAVEFKNKQFILLCIILGMIFLVRPTNVLVALIVPFFFSSLSEFTGKLHVLIKNPKVFIPGILLFFFAIFTQYLNTYWQVGEWKMNQYDHEGFDFLFNPQITNVLFSYKKGLFVYTPVLMLVFSSIVFVWKREIFKSVGWLITLSVFLFITSAWWCWWYGGGLGMRPFVDITIILFLPLIFLFKYSNPIKKWTYVLLIVPLTYAYQVYQIQYKKDILHYELMDKETFWQVFMETEERFMWAAAFEDDELPDENPLHKKTMYFDSDLFRFDSKMINSEVFKYENNDQPDIRLSVHSDSIWKQHYIGILTKFELELGDQKSNPSVAVSYFKGGQEIKNQVAHTGYRVDDLRKSEYLEIPFYPILKFNEVDSMVIIFGKGIVPTKYPSIAVDIMGFEKTNKH